MVRFASVKDREAAWENYQEVVESVKEQQKKLGKRSEEFKNEIINLAENARPVEENLIGSLFELYGEALASPVTFLFPQEEFDEKKQELQQCSDKIREAWKLLVGHKDEMLRNDKDEAYRFLVKVQEEINAAWSKWKEAKRQAYEASRSARAEKNQENIDKLETRLENLREILEKRNSHLDELQGKLGNAWNDDYRERVEGWIEEEEENIRNIKEQIVQVEQWLQEAKDRLNQ